MTYTTYTYSVSADTLNGDVNPTNLDLEIREVDITPGIVDIQVAGDDLNIIFKAALSTLEESTLDTTVSLHEAEDAIVPPFAVRVREESDDPKKRTGGHYLCKGIKHDVPVGMTDSTLSFSFPYGISVLAFEFSPLPEMMGDSFSIDIMPNTTIGVITADVAIGETVLPVSDTVLTNARLGYRCNLTDGISSQELNRILAIDKINKTITVQTPLTEAFLAASPTYFQITVPAIDTLYLHGTTAFEVGSSKIGGSFVPPNGVMRITYNNNTGTAKTFYGFVEALY